MSWIFGVCTRNNNQPDTIGLSQCHKPPLHVFSKLGFYVAAGGIEETCHVDLHMDDTTSGWMVVGTGIEYANGHARFLSWIDWSKRLQMPLSASASWIAELDGHFVAIRWNDDGIVCACDQLGQRTLYYSDTAEGIFFSTRLDWLAHATRKNDIDLEALGSKWLLFNQLSYESCIKGIKRLGPSGFASFAEGRVKNQMQSAWLPRFSGGHIEDAISVVETLADCAFSAPQNVSLGLSGGLDSRFLLAMLTRKPDQRLCVHTFGDGNDPDVYIAAAIAKSLGAQQSLFDEAIPNSEAAIAIGREYVAQTQLIEPITAAMKLRYYPMLRTSGKMMIDGGFGEIARRQYSNRLALLGRSALRRKNVKDLVRLMRVPRGQIFAPEVHRMLESGARRDLHEVLKDMPHLQDVGVGNFVDLLAVRTRVPNYGGPEQARLDGEVFNFMPFVQPSFLRAAFASDVKSRENARFYRRYIASHNGALTLFPLVKSGTTYRFGLPLIAAHTITAAKRRMGKVFQDRSPDAFLHCIKEYVQDTAQSASVVSCPLYDMSFIKEAVRRYYSGMSDYLGVVNWWLTFEIWRCGLTKDSYSG